MILYISDLDGTLLNSYQSFSKNTIKIINNLIENKELNFTIATARSINSAYPLLNDLKLKLPIILNNGISIYDPVKKEFIKEYYIDYEIGIEIINQILSKNLHPFINLLDHNNNQKIYYQGIFNFGEKDYIQKRLDAKDKRFIKYENNFMSPCSKIIQINVIDKKKNLEPIYMELLQNKNIFPNLSLDVYNNYYWLEISNKNGNKKDGIIFLKSYLNADKIISFGDNLNDLPMFEASDEKIAVSNAMKDLKEYSTEIIGSNEEDGVALYLKNKYNLN